MRLELGPVIFKAQARPEKFGLDSSQTWARIKNDPPILTINRIQWMDPKMIPFENPFLDRDATEGSTDTTFYQTRNRGAGMYTGPATWRWGGVGESEEGP